MIFRYGRLSSLTAATGSTTRMMMAAALPQKMAFFCWAGGRLREASAITTALSPDRTMLVRMIDPNAIQNVVEDSSSTGRLLEFYLLVRPRHLTAVRMSENSDMII